MENVPHAAGDAVIIGDAASPRVLRFGDKGFLSIEIEVVGRAADGSAWPFAEVPGPTASSPRFRGPRP
jgi:hypothetical protein